MLDRRKKLSDWVREQHAGQVIRKTDELYFAHLTAVAESVEAAAPLTYEIGLCHDLLEKTTVSTHILQARLLKFGYNLNEAAHVTDCVTELTRQFTKSTSSLPKKERKGLEVERLTQISPDAQTVKYADLAYNADWMMAYDGRHAKKYLQKKHTLINAMTNGNAELRNQVLAQFDELIRTFL